MKTVLSTKMLTSAQKELFLNSGLGLVAYDALQIEYLDTTIPFDVENFIFTSKNAVQVFLNQVESDSGSNLKMFCVGSKTAHLLEEKGFNVVKIEENASKLSQFIIKKHKNESFLFLCGNLRRDELPDLLHKYNVRFRELEVYRTYLIPKKFSRTFDGILFFSPSGVRSYVAENNMNKSTAFCIGETTASEVKKYTDKVVMANHPTVENVLVQAIKYFKIYD
jgi:uroporphyrinogen-III synthase